MSSRPFAHRCIGAALLATALPATALAQSSQSADDISRKLADPGAALISVPFQ